MERWVWIKHYLSPYDLYILDLMLPNINGLEICRQIRQKQLLQLSSLLRKARHMIK